MAKKEYSPFLSFDDVVRNGHSELLFRDGEERNSPKSFISIEDFPSMSPDPLESLIMKEEVVEVVIDGESNLEDKKDDNFSWTPWSHEKRIAFLKE
jgi:hypothetical protein